MSTRDDQPLKLGSPRSAVLHAILFFPLRLLVWCMAGFGWLLRGGKPRQPAARAEALPGADILARLDQGNVAEPALCERALRWIETEHPSLADSGAFSRSPSGRDPAYLREHVARWRARNRPDLGRLADEVERRMLRASELRGVLERWHSFPKDGSAVARTPATLRIRRTSNYTADSSPVPVVFELTSTDAEGRRRRVEAELDDTAIFVAALEATSAENSQRFAELAPERQAAFWENLAIHPSLFALDGCDGEVFSLPGEPRLVASDGKLVAYAAAVLDDPRRGTLLAVLVTEMGVQGRSNPLPPFVTSLELAPLLARGAPG